MTARSTFTFAPRAPKGKEKNWVQTNAGEGWFVYFRVYGVKQEFLDRSGCSTISSKSEPAGGPCNSQREAWPLVKRRR